MFPVPIFNILLQDIIDRNLNTTLTFSLFQTLYILVFDQTTFKKVHNREDILFVCVYVCMSSGRGDVCFWNYL